MNIGVFGIGGVGGYFGGKIARFVEDSASPDKVHFVARGEHLKEIKKSGLILNTNDSTIVCRPHIATDNLLDLPILDFCLICVKSNDLDGIMIKLKDRIHSNTVLLPLLNGVDIPQRMRKIITDGVILPACVYVGTHIEKPGTVTQKGGNCKILYGPDPDNTHFDLSTIKSFLDNSGIVAEWNIDPLPAIWSKFMFIASYGMITACYDVTLGQIQESTQLSGEVVSIMNEIYSIAIASGIMLKEKTIQDSITKATGFPYETKTSFQRDFEIPEKKDERDLFGGTIIRMGKELGIKTETTERIYWSICKKKVLQ